MSSTNKGFNLSLIVPNVLLLKRSERPSVLRMLRVLLLLLLLLLRHVFTSSQSQICLDVRFGFVGVVVIVFVNICDYMDFCNFFQMDFLKIFQMDFLKFFQMDFQHF